MGNSLAHSDKLQNPNPNETQRKRSHLERDELSRAKRSLMNECLKNNPNYPRSSRKSTSKRSKRSPRISEKSLNEKPASEIPIPVLVPKVVPEERNYSVSLAPSGRRFLPRKNYPTPLKHSETFSESLEPVFAERLTVSI